MNLISPMLATPPAAPQPPASAEKFDLSKIDTPTEALLMPVVDLVAGMAAGNSDTPTVATVRVKAGDQSLEYTTTPRGASIAIDGKMNDQAFGFVGRPSINASQVNVTGTVPGGDFNCQLKVVPGGFNLSGHAGEVSFEE